MATTAKPILLTRFPYLLMTAELQEFLPDHLGGSRSVCNGQNVLLFRMLRRNEETLRCTIAQIGRAGPFTRKTGAGEPRAGPY
jgi:glutathione synthase/RimK-type ligase-like ATP-grasp enzyme